MIRISGGKFPLRKFVSPNQSAIVPKGEKVKVFSFKLPESFVCFIYDVKLSPFVEWEWIIDGESTSIYSGSYHFEPPYLAKQFVEFYAKNNADVDVIAIAYCDGVCYKEIVIGDKEKGEEVEVVESLKEIKNILESKKAKGEVFDEKVEVTDKVKMIYKDGGLNWTACDITNAGPDPVYIAVNKWISPETPLLPGLTTNIDLGSRGAIKKIYLKCDKGKKATVNIRVLK